MSERKRRIEFGDFQTPDGLARDVCLRLKALGIAPDVVVEPTCGVGAFLLAAADGFAGAREILGYDVNAEYLETLRRRLEERPGESRVRLSHADFFGADWRGMLDQHPGSLLVIGNFPWVTNATQGAIGGGNLPEKTNFLGFRGFDAISGKANFDISEWMLLDVLRWFPGRAGDIAMLVKTAVARKVLAYAEKQKEPVQEAFMIGIDAKKHFNAAVDACLLVVRLNADASPCYDYTVFDDLAATHGRRVGHRQGMTVGDIEKFEASSLLLGQSPQKWRSGVKHDASGVMEFTRVAGGFENGLGEVVDLERTYLFPLFKGSDIGGNKAWREKFVLVTQRVVGESTDPIRSRAPKTWEYLQRHARQLDGRASTIYVKNPRFSVFGVGDYAFRPWRIAICGLYKALRFRLVAPIEGNPVMFDDTVYYLSFDHESEARQILAKLQSDAALDLLSSLIFWDEKRPIKTAILNVLDWSRLDARDTEGEAVREPAPAALL